MADVIERLADGLGDGSLVTDPDIVEGYRHDRSGLGSGLVPGQPVALVRARSTAEVQHVVRTCAAARVPIVPRGAGSGVSAGATAVDGCVVLSLERMRAVTVDAPGMVAVAQAGVLNAEVKAAAAQHGLWYPPDPSSYDISTIGGNVATNAGGLCCVKYGVTSDYVLGLEVVLADASVVRLGGRTVKDVAGYDLKRLFVGSEGTLGVITEATVRLRPAPAAPTTLVATFPTLVSAGEAVTTIVRTMRPSLLEIIDRPTLAAIEAYRPMGLDLTAAALLLARSDAGGQRGLAEIESMAAACGRAGATLVEHTDDPAEGEMYVAVRRLAYPAIEATGREVLIEDVAVPLPELPGMLADLDAIAAAHGVVVATVGHAGDGNLHPLVVFDRHDADATARAERAFDAIMAAAIHRGGTITGEHGVGLLKRRFLGDQVGADVLRLHRTIKAALDPDDLFNPGKVL